MDDKKLIKQDRILNDSPSLEEQITQYKKDNPEVEEALRLFNISKDHYETSISAFQSTKTYVTSSTLMPGQNG
jgi:hypothetical protein